MPYLLVRFELLIYVIESNQLGLRRNLEIDHRSNLTVDSCVLLIYHINVKRPKETDPINVGHMSIQ